MTHVNQAYSHVSKLINHISKALSKTRKSFCVNAIGIPPTTANSDTREAVANHSPGSATANSYLGMTST